MSDTAKWLNAQWADRLGPAISSMTGQPAMADPDEPSPAEPGSDALIWKQPLDAAPDATLWICVPQSIWHNIGSTILSSAGLDDAEAGEVRGTFLEVLQQSLSPLASAIGARLRREVSLRPGEALDSLPEDADWQSVMVNSADQSLGSVWLSINGALADSLEPEQPQAAQAATAAAGGPAAAPVVQGRASRTLDLLMEVELPVGVSFGRAQMRLKDAIKLTTGSIVELNRNVSEPVEIIVNNCVIARGEVVVVEGNYGVKIKQIISREERLRTLF